MKLISNTILVLLFSVLTNISHAALITETWESTITNTNSSVVGAGFKLVYSVTYDNTGTQFTDTFDSGAPDSTHCLYTGPECAVSNYSPTWSLITNFVSADFSAWFNLFDSEIDALGASFRDVYDQNMTRVLERNPASGDDFHIIDYVDDHFAIFTLYDPDAPNIGRGSALFWDNGDVSGSAIYFTTSRIVSTVSADVPAPAPLALLGIGLLVLSYNRRKAQP